LQFDPTQLPPEILPGELRVHRASADAWEQVAESSVDVTANQVTGSIQGFSTYGVLGVAVSSVTVAPSDVQLMPESTAQMTATALDDDENPLPQRELLWSIDEETIATVDDAGMVTAVDVGTTTLRVVSEGVEATASITVADANAGPEGGHLELADGAIALDIPAGALDQPVLISAVVAMAAPAATTLVDGTAYDLRPDGLPFASAVTLTMNYSEASVPMGVLMSELRMYRAAGDAWNQIEGSTPDDENPQVTALIQGFSTFAILGIPVASVEVSQTQVELAPDETVQLTATTRGADQTELPDRAVTWASNDTDVASVTQNGLVTAEGAGSAAITVASEGIEATVAITVIAPDAVPDIQVVASGLSQPVFVTAPPGDMQRVFIVEQPGSIRILRNGNVLPTAFLNIEGAVGCCGERGLLSMAFHPQYATNGNFFVYFTNNGGSTRVVRYRVSGDPDVADAASADTILAVSQPYSNHNGGLLAFGPNGYLHVGLGDGGSGGDPDGNGQDSTTLLGSLLRIDVDGDLPYEIPENNPLIGVEDARPEIWAYGLRNPWRYSFDRLTGDLYIADVGQNAWEEINVQPAGSDGGENYGWNVMEGAHCFSPQQGCNQTGLVLPVYEYQHAQGNCSLTGGYVYRGAVLPNLHGTYFYADYCVGVLRSFRYENEAVIDQRVWSEFGMLGNVTSFGEDAAGELYITTAGGTVYKIVPE
jgi:hypothetical protein